MDRTIWIQGGKEVLTDIEGRAERVEFVRS